MELNNFHNRLESLIKERKVKKKDLAVAVDLSAGMITDMTKGRGKPSLRTIKSLSEYFNVSEEWLAYGAGEKHPQFKVTTIYDSDHSKTNRADPLSLYAPDLNNPTITTHSRSVSYCEDVDSPEEAEEDPSAKKFLSLPRRQRENIMEVVKMLTDAPAATTYEVLAILSKREEDKTHARDVAPTTEEVLAGIQAEITKKVEENKLLENRGMTEKQREDFVRGELRKFEYNRNSTVDQNLNRLITLTNNLITDQELEDYKNYVENSCFVGVSIPGGIKLEPLTGKQTGNTGKADEEDKLIGSSKRSTLAGGTIKHNDIIPGDKIIIPGKSLHPKHKRPPRKDKDKW
ncbi:helix-turn-helix domain-containing protein [Trichlorobacter lovleyi]|uniref:helix-turn-helix domain-containing protein n=1 Tax=Trichlorobacter lovleyi TaxID=313985 RepID=UPI003D0A22C7